jgi:bifunctional UDP-N-acetylglucosamine pyrophosphorylase/glucosamine-1-phosphate N-acetyltransferase
MSGKRAAIILAAGQGTRMKSALPKVLHQVGGRAMLDWAIAAARESGAERVVVVVGPHAPEVRAHLEKTKGADAIAVQAEALGTAHAVRAAEAEFANYEGDIAILYGDAPLIPAEAIASMFTLRGEKQGMVVLGFEAFDPTGYGRLVLAHDGTLVRIVEQKDASKDERAISLCNSGVLCADAKTLFQLLAQVKNENVKREYYLTDVIGLGRMAAHTTHVVRGLESDVLGVNSRIELAVAESAFQMRSRRKAMESGVTLLDPATVYFSHDTIIENDVVIEPGVYLGLGVKIAKGARIKAYSHIEGAEIGEGANVGPFARLRPGAKLGPKVKIGNFVEVKNATFAEKAQASHLSYIGDASVGAAANIGAGTITCNYDGFSKYKTEIGAGAFIGSDTALVAPVKVGEGAYTGSGSVITVDVPADALAVARGRQRNLDGWAKTFREKKSGS